MLSIFHTEMSRESVEFEDVIEFVAILNQINLRSVPLLTDVIQYLVDFVGVDDEDFEKAEYGEAIYFLNDLSFCHESLDN